MLKESSSCLKYYNKTDFNETIENTEISINQ